MFKVQLISLLFWKMASFIILELELDLYLLFDDVIIPLLEDPESFEDPPGHGSQSAKGFISSKLEVDGDPVLGFSFS